MKIKVYPIFFLFFPFLSFSQSEDNSIQQAINKFTLNEELLSSAISFMAYDLDNDQTLANHNSKLTIPTASTTKLFSTAAAFELLGKDYRPKTELYYSGFIDNDSILHGDIVIRGLGDPSLASGYFYKKEEQDKFLIDWVELIKKKGIKQVDGKVLADGSAFGYNGVPDGWSWSDLGNYYGAGPSGIALYDNMTYLHFSTSSQLNGPTYLDSMTPNILGFELDNQVQTYNGNADNAYIYGGPFSNKRFATGSLPRSKTNFQVKSSIPDPELLLAQLFERVLNENEVSVLAPAICYRTYINVLDTLLNYNKLTFIHSQQGKTVNEIAYWTNLRSVNFFAEQLLCLIGYEKGGNGSSSYSTNYVVNFWNSKLGTQLFMRDGSGLSRSNGFSSDDFILLLKYMYKSKNYKDFLATLPVAGESGTLRSVGRGQVAQGRVMAKSGTMNKIKSYAGYVTSKSGKNIAFAITINNYGYSNAQLMKEIEKVMNAMAGY